MRARPSASPSCRLRARRHRADCSWCAAQNLNRALDLVLAADQRIDAAFAGLLVEVDAVGRESLVALFGRGLAARLLLRTADAARARPARHLGLAVADVVDRIEPGHALVLEERHGVAVALGEQRNQHVGPVTSFRPRTGRARRRVGRRAGNPRSAAARCRSGDDPLKPVVDEGFEIVPQPVDVDPACLEDRFASSSPPSWTTADAPASHIHDDARPRARRRDAGTSRVLGQHGHRTTRLEKRTTLGRLLFLQRALERC